MILCCVNRGFLNVLYLSFHRYRNSDKKCPAKLVRKKILGVFTYSMKGSHNHMIDPRDEKVEEVKAKQVKLAQTTSMSTREIVAASKAGQSRDTLAVLPSDSAMSNKIRKQRTGDHPTIPDKLEKLTLPDKYTTSAEGEDFVLLDSGPNPDRFIMFSTKTNMDFLTTCDSIHMDGTFSTCPALFNQLYVIIGMFMEYICLLNNTNLKYL